MAKSGSEISREELQWSKVVGMLRGAARVLDEIVTVLRGIGADGWRGQAALAFRDLVADDLRPRVERASEAFTGAVRALDGWLEFMAGAQLVTRGLERDAAEALVELARAQGAADSFTSPADPGGVRALDEHAAALATAARLVSLAQERLDRARRTAQRHGEDYQARGAQVARVLQAAIDAAPNEPGLWSSLGDLAGGALGKLEDIAGSLGDRLLGTLHDFAPILQAIGDVAGMFGTVAALLALAPGCQFLAVPALVLGLVALGAHYLNDAGRQGSFVKALTTKDVLLDAVGVVAGAGALKTGKGMLDAAKAAGAPTRVVPQLVGPPKELPVSYLHLATHPYAMGQAEFGWRLTSYHATASSVVAVTAGANDGISDLRNWRHLEFLKPVEGNTP